MSATTSTPKRRLAKRTKRASGAAATITTENLAAHDSFYVLFPQPDSTDTPEGQAANVQEPFAFNDGETSMEVDKDAPTPAIATGADDAVSVPPAASTTMATSSPNTPLAAVNNDTEDGEPSSPSEPVDGTDAPAHASSEPAPMLTEEPTEESATNNAVPDTALPSDEAADSPPSSADDAMDQQEEQEPQPANNKRPRQDDQPERETFADGGHDDVAKSTETNGDTAEADDESTVTLPLKKRRRMLVPEDDSEGNDNATEAVTTAPDRQHIVTEGDDDNDDDEAESSDIVEDSTVDKSFVTNMDDYPIAMRYLGITRLSTFIGYMLALVVGGHCRWLRMGPAGPSGRPALEISPRFDVTADGRRFVCGVDCRLYGGDSMIERALPHGSTVSGKGTAFDPYVATIKGAVAVTPEIVEPLYDDWAPSLFDQRLARPQDKIVLRFALADRADRDEACAPLACLLDDGDDTPSALPPAKQRVSVHLDAVWRRLAAHPHMFKAAAKHAEHYRSLVASAAATSSAATDASSPASPLTAVSTPIAASS
ncbi:Mycoplas LppA superfamily incomplete domain containing protein [Pandoravirus celtis]|uniref:Mycoplas LppA superfamily incomplete domain containing protein n=1 Tax=Pandoravirus celtis TaxID=2568002 RepID=A0A4D6EKN9_9VIRU|nr:Mycoplas LppA superfamily incomplete domain containing protein [Pandoravirus celtis]